MRILLITNDWLPKKGGITTYLSSLVDSVGHEFTIYAPSWAKGANLINSSASFFLNGKDTVKEITDIVYNEKIDIILHGSSNPQFLLVNKLDQILNTENPKSIKIPQFMICHGAEFNILNYIPVVRTLLKRNLNKLNKVFTVSEFSKKKLQDITETDIVNISAGVVIPPTKKEFESYINETDLSAKDLLVHARQVRDNLDIQHFMVTLGSEGVLYVGDTIEHYPAVETNVYDVTGAGDTFTAALAICCDMNYPIYKSVIVANIMAGEAVKTIGTYMIDMNKLAKVMEETT